MRRPPLGHVLATAHDMGREYRVITALAGSGVPVPVTRAFCDDPDGDRRAVLRDGQGRGSRSCARVNELADVRRRRRARACPTSSIDVLARLHGIDYDAVGLGDFGRPDGFLARNVARWGKQWEASKTRELPADRRARPAASRPRSPSRDRRRIVHGDYRLENTMLAPDAPEIVAVLDWEMSTLGDPLTDLGLFLVYWVHWGNADDAGPLATRRRDRPARVHQPRRSGRPLRRRHRARPRRTSTSTSCSRSTSSR